MLKVTGARRIVTMDLHAAQIQGFFDIPVDNLMAMPVLCNYLKKEGLCDDKIVVVSPDAGGVHRAELFAKRLNSTLAIVFKRRPEPDVSEAVSYTHLDVYKRQRYDRRTRRRSGAGYPRRWEDENRVRPRPAYVNGRQRTFHALAGASRAIRQRRAASLWGKSRSGTRASSLALGP